MKKYFFFLVAVVLLSSCARVGSPNGGNKDTIPPVFLKANIDTSRVNIPTDLKELRLDFNEYINLKDINKNLIISPPIKKIKKILPSNLANKYILIQWEENLLENTTYSFNFGNAIVDNNEGNVLPYFKFAFSTGKEIDNLFIKGKVIDAMLPPKKKPKSTIVVGLYPEGADFKQKPYYITKANDDGNFELDYLSTGKYTLIAFEDENQNSVYDAGKEKVGFLKNKIELSESISGLNLKIYPSQKTLKYVDTQPMIGGILMRFEGNPKNVAVTSISEELKNYKVQHQALSDSVKIWVGKENNQFKKESATQIKLSYTADHKKDTISTFFKPNEKEELVLANQKGHLLPPHQAFVISSNMALENIKPELWQLKNYSVKQAFEAKISEVNSSEIKISANFKAGKNYTLHIPKESVSSFYHQNEKTYIFNFEIDKPENYGSFVLKLKNKPTSHFWVQLMNNEGEVQYQKYTNLSEIRFTELKPATYFVRILVDNNGNGHWDGADFVQNIHAENAFVFSKEISVRKLWEIIEDWDLD